MLFSCVGWMGAFALFCSGSSSAVGVLCCEFLLKPGVGRLLLLQRATDSQKHIEQRTAGLWVEERCSWCVCVSVFKEMAL